MFPYIGGKSHHAKWLNEEFPNSFNTFVEVFGGAGWVTLKSEKVKRAETRIYNDFNPYLANVFECFRTKPEELLQIMKQTEKSVTEIYRQFQKELFGVEDFPEVVLGNVDLAMKYLYLQTQVFAGTALSEKNVPYFTEVKSKGKYNSKYETLIKKLQKPELVQTLKSIDRVENIDCVELIKKYDGENVFFYLDPPYYNMEFYYSKDFPKEKHQELAETLRNIKGKFALSYYDFEELHQLYPENEYRWFSKEVYRTASTRSANKEGFDKRSRGTEILIMNYQKPDLFSL